MREGYDLRQNFLPSKLNDFRSSEFRAQSRTFSIDLVPHNRCILAANRPPRLLPQAASVKGAHRLPRHAADRQRPGTDLCHRAVLHQPKEPEKDAQRTGHLLLEKRNHWLLPGHELHRCQDFRPRLRGRGNSYLGSLLDPLADSREIHTV